MNKHLVLLTVLILMASPALCQEKAEPSIKGSLDSHVLTTGKNSVVILDAKGKVVWQHKTALTHDAWLLPNGNVLFADGKTVAEVTREKKVVFQYKSKTQKGGGTYACQRLADGKTMIGENSTGKILEVDAKGTVVFELQTKPAKVGNHHNLRMVRKLANGNYLACHSGPKMVREYKPDGTVVWEKKTAKLAFAAIRTPANTTLIATLDHITEYDAGGKQVWQFANTDISGTTITNMTGMHLLKNGNIITGCYRSYKGKDGTGMLEITKEKKAVWSFHDRSLGSHLMAVQKLTDKGACRPGATLR